MRQPTVPEVIVAAGCVVVQHIGSAFHDPGDTKHDSIPLAAVTITAVTSAGSYTMALPFRFDAITDALYSASPVREPSATEKSG